ncbi:MAG TPA: lysylphosphatidylglycerol synthase transmembrane domain-containing protein [Candidatus Limnocylindrales bacterium]|nr:lysylphosphatidylglycerol synthase transmembrane domain-containing protein [Candidatus Limnocylindrales bacterium]
MLEPTIPARHARRRDRPGWLWALALAIGGVLLVSQASSLADAMAALVSVEPSWLLAGTALVLIRFAAAGISLQAVVAPRIGLRDGLALQLACTFVSRITPEGVGWVVVTQRYLERIGVPRADAMAAIALKVAASGVTRVAIIVAVLAMVGSAALERLEAPAIDPLLLALVPVSLIGVVVIALVLRRHALAIVRLAVAAVDAAWTGTRALAHEPGRLLALLVSTAAMTILAILVLGVSAAASGADVRLLDVFVVYLASSAISALSPTPGNLGATELAFTAGFVAIGVPPGPALAAVLLYRLLTFWLPILPGLIAYRQLAARGSI